MIFIYFQTFGNRSTGAKNRHTKKLCGSSEIGQFYTTDANQYC